MYRTEYLVVQAKSLNPTGETETSAIRDVLKRTHTSVIYCASILTSQVLVHDVGSVLHEQAEHGGATGAALQPQQDRGFVLVGLSNRGG